MAYRFGIVPASLLMLLALVSAASGEEETQSQVTGESHFSTTINLRTRPQPGFTEDLRLTFRLGGFNRWFSASLDDKMAAQVALMDRTRVNVVHDGRD